MIGTLMHFLSRAAEPVPAQRRRFRRFHCAVPVRCSMGKDVYPATIVDISRCGVRVQIAGVVKPGTLVSVSYGPTQHTRVSWVRHHGAVTEIGLVFNDNANDGWVPPLLKRVGGAKSHMEPRHAVRFPSQLAGSICEETSDLAAQVSGLIFDLSAGGASFSGSPTLQTGSPVVLRIDGPRGSLTLHGRVVRRGRLADGPIIYGIQFVGVKEKDHKQLQAILADLVAAARRPTAR